MRRKITVLQKIRKEYNEPFQETVKGYAVMGYSRKATAGILGLCKSYFYSLCKTYNLDQYFKKGKDLNSSCKPTGRPKGRPDNRPKRYSNEYLLSILRGYSPNISPIRYNQLQCKPSCDTIIRRFGSWKKAKQLAHRKVKNEQRA